MRISAHEPTHLGEERLDRGCGAQLVLFKLGAAHRGVLQRRRGLGAAQNGGLHERDPLSARVEADFAMQLMGRMIDGVHHAIGVNAATLR